MTTIIAQVRLPIGLDNELNEMLKGGFYTSKSDIIRHAIRKLIVEEQMEKNENSADSVKKVRKIRNKFSKEQFNIDEINSLNKC